MIKVVELFAGVGGFRIGLEGYPRKKRSPYKVVWSNQWEPSTKMQHANLVYQARWGEESHNDRDISTVKVKEIPNHDLLVGGFPCQDYSVATTLKRSGGLIGKKGVLWWEIYRIIKGKKADKPKYLMLENVDRLLKSPATQRGRDFAIMLASLNELGYAVEWKVINAADYGFPQRRRRIFILAYHKSTPLYKQLEQLESKGEWIEKLGVAAIAFKGKLEENLFVGELDTDIVKISKSFNKGKKLSPFKSSGVMINGIYYTQKYKAKYAGKSTVLGDILIEEKDVPKEYFINNKDVSRWKYLKGSKNEKRYNKANDFWYSYNEGAMIFPDPLDKPSRTIITGEGGVSPSRFKHVVQPNKRKRRLVPLELERLNMFPDNHTKVDNVTDAKRAFFMGNALVVGVVEKLGKELAKRINTSTK